MMDMLPGGRCFELADHALRGLIEQDQAARVIDNRNALSHRVENRHQYSLLSTQFDFDASQSIGPLLGYLAGCAKGFESRYDRSADDQEELGSHLTGRPLDNERTSRGDEEVVCAESAERQTED